MRKKAALAALLTLTLCLTSFLKGAPESQAEAQGDIKVIVSGQELTLKTPAFIEKAAAIVPLREIAEALGAEVDYGESAAGVQTVRLERGARTAVITIDNKSMEANGRDIVLPAAPRIANGVALVPLRAISEALGAVVAWDGVKRIITVDEPQELPRVGTAENLLKLLQAADNRSSRVYLGMNATATVAGETGAARAVQSESAADNGAGSAGSGGADQHDFSATNVQVDGVDEADWAKTDGHYVYQISGSRVLIADISNPDAPRLAATLEYDDKDGFYPQELYVDGDRLLVIGQQHLHEPMPAGITDGAENGSSPGGGAEGSSTGASAPSRTDAVEAPQPNGGDTPTTSGSAQAGASGDALAVSPSSGKSAVAADNASADGGWSASEPAVGPSTSPAVMPAEGMRMIWPPYRTLGTVKTYIYELDETGQPALTRELVQEGSYLTSRKIGSALYIITNKYSYIYPMYDTFARSGGDGDTPEAAEAAAEQLASAIEPVYGDSAVSDGLLTLPLDDVRYFPEPTDSSMMLVGAADLDRPEEPLQVSAYLGSGTTVYASQKHLYVALAKYKQGQGGAYEQETQFHKFRLDHGQTVYIGEGSVPGALLNQFSMDEHEGYFRVAITKGDMWASGAQGSSNNMYVLDEKLAVVGKLEGLAPGERIYSARFMGDRAYMVTFRNIDPLFAIDLRDPANPSVLGQLKIPGYSDYLHPYDEHHIIGFGKDTLELPSKGSGPDDTIAYAQGIKIALFDVTDVNNPKEKFKEIIGDRGTDSELLYNHKALLFSKAKGLMAFPVQLHEIGNKEQLDPSGFPAYGDFTYQGAYVYGIDLEQGFRLRGRVSHLSEEDLRKSGQYGYDYTKSVKRILYAGDTLYTLSEAMLKANDLSSLNERGSLQYPALPSGYRGGGAIDIMPLPAIVE